QTAGDAIRRTEISGDTVELARRHAVQMLPRLARAEALIRAAIGAEEQTLGATRVNGQGMTIRMHLTETILAKCFSAGLRDVQSKAQHIYMLFIGGIDANLAEVEGALIQRVHTRPGLAFVFRSKHAAAFAAHFVNAAEAAGVALHDGVNDLGVFAVNI